MIYNGTYKKRISRRKTNKLYQLGGVLSEIDKLIKNMNNDDLSKLEKYADSMTIQQTYNMIIKFIDNFEDNRLSESHKILLQILTPDFVEYPNLLKNIQTLIDDLRQWDINLLKTQYSTLPISKINVKLGNIKTENDSMFKIYNGNYYELVGSGGFGSVYVNLDVNEAIKEIKHSHPNKFQREAINYNNISSLVCNTNYFCNFKSCFIDINHDKIYILMEYCGKNLNTSIDELKESHDLSFEKMIEWFITIAKGIQCMHDNGYVHLDIKPDNITIYNNEAKLIDFGLAHNISDIKKQLVMGTRNFMAPEMIDEIKGIDYKICDIYSLGITFAYCIFNSIFKNATDKKKINDERVLSLIGLESMVSYKPTDRPTISAVIEMLNSVSIDDLHNAGLNPVELHYAGFNLLDIFKAGYNYGEIRDIFKLNKYPELEGLLQHCDKKWSSLKRHKSKKCTFNTICSSNPTLQECRSFVKTPRKSRVKTTGWVSKSWPTEINPTSDDNQGAFVRFV